MRFKVGVKLPPSGVLDPRMFVAFDAIEYAWADLLDDAPELDDEPTITSWADSTHGPNSYHYRNGRAVDVRTKTIPRDMVRGFAMTVAKRITHLGFDVLLEDLGGVQEHLHVELDQRADV